MQKITVTDSLKRSQEKYANNMMAVGRHKIADSYFKVAEEDCKDIHEKGICAGILNNFAKIMDSAPGQALTTSQDFGPYVMEVWPLVTAWYPNFPLKDLISVQDMDKPLAYLFFSVLKAGTNKSDTVVGDVVETATGMRTIRGKYPTGEIVGETIQPTDITSGTGALLAYAPLNVATIPGYLEKTQVKIGTDIYKAESVANGVIQFSLNGTVQDESVIALEVNTGLLSGSAIDAVESAGTGTVVVNYVWNLDYAKTENIQTVKEQVELRPMEAIPRALMLEWTLFSEYLKKSQFGQDIREDNTRRVLDLLYQYQVRYILDEMFDYAAGATVTVNGQTVTPNTTINLAISNNYALEVQVANVMKQLKVVANAIELASGRMEGNRIVCGQNFKAYLESLPTNYFQPTKNDAAAFSGPREIGTFGTFKVYYDPYRAADEGFMTYRGKEWYDASYYLGEYMPIVPTDAIALGVTVRSSFVSMEAYRYDKKTCVYQLTFTL